jgi:hypothetical protein
MYFIRQRQIYFFPYFYMENKKAELIYFGDQCAPGILINDILRINEKQLFQLGIYHFNDIIWYLKKDKLHEIYDINFLYTNANKKLVVHPTISETKFYHGGIANHSVYKFSFNHNYNINKEHILNYQHNVDSFKGKIEKFEKSISNKDNFLYFINFVDRTNPSEIPKVDAMIESILKKRDNFKIIFFTDSQRKYVGINQSRYKQYYHAIFLNQSYLKWYSFDPKKKYSLYNEIYSKFYQVDSLIQSQFPKFDQTPYYKNYKSEKDFKN